MVLTFSSNGNFVELSIMGYEFPVSDDKYDSNWLIVQAKLKGNGKEECFREACLLTWDLQKLRDHFLQRASKEQLLSFLEPELSFRLSEDLGRCTIYLRYGFVPSWAENRFRADGLAINFDPNVGVENYLHILDLLCKSYPTRDPVK